MSNTSMTQADFERLLEVYGGDRTRWPTEARAAAAQLVARQPQARRLLAEAEALDRALERAPLPSLASEAALAGRIVAAAQRTPRMVKITGAASAAILHPADSDGMAARPAAGAQWRSRLSSVDARRAAGLLAASLALGIFMGLSSLPQRVLPTLEEMAGLATGHNGNNRAMAQLDLFEEDIL